MRNGSRWRHPCRSTRLAGLGARHLHHRSQILGGTATYGEMLRTLGFAQSPNVLLIFSAIPLLGGLLRFVLLIWVLLAGLIAIRQALDVGTGKAIITAILGWIVMVIIVGIVASVFGIGLPTEEAGAILGTLAIG